MEEVKNFIKECGAYFLATVDGDEPKVRPFGTINIFEGKLYIQTGTFKNVSKQIHQNGKVQLCAMDKSGTKWLRLSGTLVSDDRVAPKADMLEHYPELKKMYSAEDPRTEVFYFTDATATFCSFTEEPFSVKF